MLVAFLYLQFVDKLKQIGRRGILTPSTYFVTLLLRFITDKYFFDHRSAATNAARTRLLLLLSSIEFGFYNFYNFLFDLLNLRAYLFQYISL